MTLSGLALRFQRAEKVEGGFGRRIWRLIAYLGRYAHQPAEVSLQMPVDDLQSLAEATAKLLDEEAEAARPRGD